MYKSITTPWRVYRITILGQKSSQHITCPQDKVPDVWARRAQGWINSCRLCRTCKSHQHFHKPSQTQYCICSSPGRYSTVNKWFTVGVWLENHWPWKAQSDLPKLSWGNYQLDFTLGIASTWA